MFQDKIIYSLLGAVAALFIVSKYDDVIEGFVGNLPTNQERQIVRPKVVKKSLPVKENFVNKPAYKQNIPQTFNANTAYSILPVKETYAAPVKEEWPVLPLNTGKTIIEEDVDINIPVVYDRVIYTNNNSRLRSQGDMIRGDLPIKPNSSDWFRPSVRPSVDLQRGAMNVMGGVSLSKEMDELMESSSKVRYM